MWKPIYDPGSWQQYLKRGDNKNLPLMEVRKKYLEEQILFENYVSHLQTLNTISPSTGGGGFLVSSIAGSNDTSPGGGENKDTGSNDTGSNDTGSNDTGSNDTGSNDTGSNDTGSFDIELSGSGLIGSSNYFTSSRTLYAYYPAS